VVAAKEKQEAERAVEARKANAANLAQRVYFWETYNAGQIRIEVFNDDNTITGYISGNVNGVKGFTSDTGYWVLGNGVYRCGTQKPITNDVVYLVIDNSGKAMIPAFNMTVAGAWLTPNLNIRGVMLFSHAMASTKNYPIIFVNPETKTISIAIRSNPNQQPTNRKDMVYTENGGKISFSYNNKDYIYFIAATGQLIRLSGDDTLAAIYNLQNR